MNKLKNICNKYGISGLVLFLAMCFNIINYILSRNAKMLCSAVASTIMFIGASLNILGILKTELQKNIVMIILTIVLVIYIITTFIIL